MTRTFEPADETEADAFIERFCDHCFNDSHLLPCPILLLALSLASTDPGYPAEWIVDDVGQPTCTSFDPDGRAILAAPRARVVLS